MHIHIFIYIKQMIPDHKNAIMYELMT